MKYAWSCSLLLIFAFLFNDPQRVFAQEQIATDGVSKSIVKSYAQDKPSNTSIETRLVSSSDTLTLPFLDDFSAPGIFPDATLWFNNDVYVNNSMAFYPITYGVATFDGVNHRGNPYNMLSPTTYGFADSLVSHPMR